MQMKSYDKPVFDKSTLVYDRTEQESIANIYFKIFSNSLLMPINQSFKNMVIHKNLVFTQQITDTPTCISIYFTEFRNTFTHTIRIRTIRVCADSINYPYNYCIELQARTMLNQREFEQNPFNKQKFHRIAKRKNIFFRILLIHSRETQTSLGSKQMYKSSLAFNL